MAKLNNKNAQGVSLPATRAAVEVTGLDAAIIAALVTKGTLAKAAAVSTRTIETWANERRISVVRLGKRCVRFHLPTVMAELRRCTVEAVK